jgi:hypothetical protein
MFCGNILQLVDIKRVPMELYDALKSRYVKTILSIKSGVCC